MYIHSVVDYHEKKKNKINSQKGSLSSGLTSTGSNFTFLLFCELRNVSIFISKTFHSFWMCFLKESFNFSILFPFVFFLVFFFLLSFIVVVIVVFFFGGVKRIEKQYARQLNEWKMDNSNKNVRLWVDIFFV